MGRRAAAQQRWRGGVRDGVGVDLGNALLGIGRFDEAMAQFEVLRSEAAAAAREPQFRNACSVFRCFISIMKVLHFAMNILRLRNIQYLPIIDV